MLNAGVVAAKLHLGWRAVLDHHWEHDELPYPIPNVAGMTWSDLLPTQVFSVEQPKLSLPPDTIDERPCPNCFWGGYESVRMKKRAEAAATQQADTTPPITP